MDNILALHEVIQSWLNQFPVLTQVIYFALFTLVSAFGLPGAAILMLAGGATMGFVHCTLLSNLASTCGALLSLVIARHVFPTRWQERTAHWLPNIRQHFAANEVSAMLSLRLAPVIPYAVLNYAVGFTTIRYWTFFWTSFVGMLPGTMLYVNVGAAASTVGQVDDLYSPRIVAALFALAALPWLIQRLARRR